MNGTRQELTDLLYAELCGISLSKKRVENIDVGYITLLNLAEYVRQIQLQLKAALQPPVMTASTAVSSVLPPQAAPTEEKDPHIFLELPTTDEDGIEQTSPKAHSATKMSPRFTFGQSVTLRVEDEEQVKGNETTLHT